MKLHQTWWIGSFHHDPSLTVIAAVNAWIELVIRNGPW